jgi:TonB family protein
MSVTASMALHVGGIFFFLQAAKVASKAPEIRIDNVDLLIQTHKIQTAPQVAAPKPKPTSMMDLMKMTLPTVPRAAAPRPVDIKLPELQRPHMLMSPKLEDRHMQQLAKLDALDLNKRRVNAAQIDTKLEDRHTAALAALPRLEEVGQRQVRNLPAAIKLEEQRQDAVALKAIQDMGVSSMRRGVAPAAVLQEATPEQSSRLGRAITSFLPTASEPVQLQPRSAEPPPMMRKIETAPPAIPKRAAAVQEAKKKAVEIEGPLAGRKVVSYDVPQFPDWAKQRNIIEAEVVILFYVDPDGSVLPDMRVENTSGYGQLDRLSMDSLRNWKFVPISTSERQWGKITFRFVLE